MMEILNINKVQRDHIRIKSIELIRIKTYNSETSKSNVMWYFLKDKVKVKENFHKYLEKRYLKYNRKYSTIYK